MTVAPIWPSLLALMVPSLILGIVLSVVLHKFLFKKYSHGFWLWLQTVLVFIIFSFVVFPFILFYVYEATIW